MVDGDKILEECSKWDFHRYIFLQVISQTLHIVCFPGLIWASSQTDCSEFWVSQVNLYSLLSPSFVVGRGSPSRAPRVGSCLTLSKQLSKQTCADKARDFIGRGHPDGEQEGKGIQENCSATWLTVLGFMLMGLVSRLSLANQFDSESFLVAHASFSQDGC